MAKGINNCCYDKIKLLHSACKMLWFIEKHAHDDAQKVNDSVCVTELNELKKDLEKHIETLKKLVANDLK